jgi:isopentenyl diphosphate isomerase/L-lactate dehydrogenase-like FMN-dependent dehydrogenase
VGRTSKLANAFTIADLRALAGRRLPKAIFDYIDGGAETETAMNRNIEDFKALTFMPRILVDVAQRELSVPILGAPSALPVVIAPTGMAALAWAKADIALVRAACAAGVPSTVSTMASASLEDIRNAAPDARLWFQLYMVKDRAAVRSLIARAAGNGCEALVLTVDVPIGGRRLRDLKNGITLPVRPTPGLVWDILSRPLYCAQVLRHGFPKLRNLVPAVGGSQASTASRQLDASLSWTDVGWLRDQWQGRIVIKGVLTPEDAVRAVHYGFDAIVLSNHGGRQLDCAPSGLSMLSAVRSAIGTRAEVLVDGGVRQGSDIAKALALGATGVMVGRATLYGVAAGGEQGTTRAIDILASEFDRCLALLGCPRARNLDARFVRRHSGLSS